MGKEVKTLISDNLKPGRYSVQWDGRNKFGELVSSGVYFCILRTTDYIETRKMLFVR